MSSILLMLSIALLGRQAPGSDEGYRSDQVMVQGSELTDSSDVQTLGEMLELLLRALSEQFGLETPQLRVRFEIGDPHNQVLLKPDGQMLLRYESANKFRPTSVANVPLARALLHAVIRWHLIRLLKSPYGLSEGLIDGFAQYIADDTLQQAAQAFNLPAEKASPATAKYRRLLADLDAAVGRPALSFAVTAVATAGVEGFRYASVFRDALVSASGEAAIEDLFPKAAVESPLGLVLGPPGAPTEENPSVMISSHRVLNGIPLLQVAGRASTELERIAIFDGLWQYVKERYPDASLKATDWSGAYDQLRPLVGTCADDVDFFLLVRQLLATLRDPNTRLLYPAGATYFHLPVGLQIDLLGDDPVVTEVTEGSLAQQRGVQRGMIVQQVDGVEAKRRIDQFSELTRLWEGLPSDRQRRNRAANQVLAGPPGTEAKVVFRSDASEPLSITLPREALRAGDASKTAVESRVLEGNVGYLKINSFAEGLSGQFAAAIDAMANPKALLIDVRASQNAPQGARFAAESVCKLIAQPGIVGNWEMRNKDNVQRYPQRLVPTQNPYRGPVLLLVDEWTFGTAEVFALMLKTMSRARLVGTQTVGAHYDPRDVAVPLGPAKAMMSTVVFVPPVPMLIEGYGLPPDVVVPRTLDDVRAGRDAILERALQLCRE